MGHGIERRQDGFHVSPHPIDVGFDTHHVAHIIQSVQLAEIGDQCMGAIEQP